RGGLARHGRRNDDRVGQGDPRRDGDARFRLRPTGPGDPMKVTGIAYMGVVFLLFFPLVLKGGMEYLRFVLAFKGWVIACAALTVIGISFLLRRLLELALKTPGTAMRLARAEQREE